MPSEHTRGAGGTFAKAQRRITESPARVAEAGRSIRSVGRQPRAPSRFLFATTSPREFIRARLGAHPCAFFAASLALERQLRVAGRELPHHERLECLRCPRLPSPSFTSFRQMDDLRFGARVATSGGSRAACGRIRIPLVVSRFYFPKVPLPPRVIDLNTVGLGDDVNPVCEACP